MIPPRIRLYGNLPVAGMLIPNGHSQLEVLKNSMKFQKLNQSESTIRYPDGIVIKCVSNSGLDYIDIYAPTVSGGKHKTELTWKASDDYLLLYEDCEYSYQYLYSPKNGTLSLIVKYRRLSYNLESAIGTFPGDTNGLQFYSYRHLIASSHDMDSGVFNYYTGPDAPSDQYDCARLVTDEYGYSMGLPRTHTLSGFYSDKTWYVVTSFNKLLHYGHTTFGSTTGKFDSDVTGILPFNERDVFVYGSTHLYGYAYNNHGFILDIDTEDSSTRQVFGCCRRTFDTELIHQEKLEYKNLILSRSSGNIITNLHTHYQNLNYIGADPNTAPNRAAWNTLCEDQLGYDMYLIPAIEDWGWYNFNPFGYIRSTFAPYESKFYASTIESPYAGKIYDADMQKAYQPVDYLFYHNLRMNMLNLPLVDNEAYYTPCIHHGVGKESSLVFLNYVENIDLGINVFYQEKTLSNQPLSQAEWKDLTDNFLALFETAHGSEFFPRYLRLMMLHSVSEGKHLDKVNET